jgi:competence protein ComGC
MAVSYPFREFEAFGKSLTKLGLYFLIALAICVYSHALATSELDKIETGRLVCTNAAHSIKFAKAFTLVNIFINIIIPFFLIFLFNCLFSVKLIKKVKSDLNSGGCFASGGLMKSEDDSLFIRKQIFRHKLLNRQLAIAKTHRARSVKHIFSRYSDNTDILNSSKKRVLSHNHNLVVCPSAHSASSRIVSLRVKFSSKLVRSKSLNELSELNEQHKIKIQSRVKSTVIEDPVGYHNKKKSTKALNVLRNSMRMKRNKQYIRAVFLVIISSLFFFFLPICR